MMFHVRTSELNGLDVELRCIKINSQFEYEMEMPPNCTIKINNTQPIPFQTNPLIAQRRKDAPLSIKALLKPKTSSQELQFSI